jgi:hypothetical protein
MHVLTRPGGRRHPFAVLIPSRGRAAQLAKALKTMPWLNNADTILGIEAREWSAYRDGVRAYAPQATVELYNNPGGSVALAREHLRMLAVGRRRYDYYVVTDDNARHGHDALHALVGCAATWRTLTVVVAGMHNTAPHFDRLKIGKAEMVGGYRSYPQVGMIFQVYPHALYSRYGYPTDAYGLDDRHLALHAYVKGYDFRVCMDAPFTKTRYQAGGQGTLDERAWKTGMAIARLATDFPAQVGAVGTLRVPWQFLMDARDNGGTVTGTRLAGGAMRKESALQQISTVRVKKVVRRSGR